MKELIRKRFQWRKWGLLFMVGMVVTVEGYAQAMLRGKVTDRDTGEPLPGANVVIQGTLRGAATDVDGNFLIPGVAPGQYTLVISYVGYERAEVPVRVTESDRTVEVNVRLVWVGIMGQEVVITAQVAGQLAAINEQFSSSVVKNVVSRDRILELPDNNAAESIGRLPGIVILRSGGEATNVAIRGLLPKYNTVTVNGVRLPDTDPSNRVVDLSLISSNVLDGIEVRKAITPDMDADAVGGNIDLRLRSAPSGWMVDLLATGGYAGLQNYWGNYKFVGTASNRFLNERLGVIVTFNTDRYNRSADKLGINWTADDINPRTNAREPRFDSFNLREETVFRGRTGGSVLLDYNIAGGRLLGNLFYNALKDDAFIRRYGPSVDNLQGSVEDYNTRTAILTSGLGVEQRLGSFRYDVQTFYTRSRRNAPENYVWEFWRDGTALTVGRAELFGLSPDSVWSLVRHDSTMQLTSIWVDSERLDEDQYGLQANLQQSFHWGWVSGYVKLGGKLRWLERAFDRERNGRQGLRYPSDNVERCLLQTLGFEWEARYAFADSVYGVPGLPIALIQRAYKRQGQFLEGQYGLGPVADESLLMELTRALRASPCQAEYQNNTIESLGRDYNGIERYQAAYVMAELKLGRQITLIPGIRYERDFSRYNGQRFREVTSGYNYAPPADLEPLRVERENIFWLPMIHLDVRPVSWMALRLARTETISRPSYYQYAPITSINTWRSFIWAANAKLRPSHATNYDASLQFATSRFGLFGVSVFYKRIDDLLIEVEYPAQLFRDVNGDTTVIGVPEGTNVPRAWLIGASPQLQTTINNEEPAKYWGYELEWQTNFSYLPGALKGLVLSFNYTRGFSETTYHYYRKLREYVPGSRPPRYVYSLIDTTRTGRMPGQAAHVLNITLGYDYKGFSARLSYLYQSDIADYVNPRERLNDVFVGPYSRFDLSIRQKIRANLELYANLNNVNNRPDERYTGQDTLSPDYHFSRQYLAYRELYGYTVDVGFRYRF